MGGAQMNVLQRGVLTLVRSALTEERLSIPVEFDLELAAKTAHIHQIDALLYAGAVCCGLDKREPQLKQLFQLYCQNLLISSRQVQAVEKVCAALDEAELDYMPLKGCRIKKLYPKAELRTMGDADILIREEQYGEVRVVVERLGYEESDVSTYEFVWRSRELKLELHKRLLSDQNKDFYRYFGDGWKRATIKNGTQYSMMTEDEYIYLFMHFAKHYRNGGIGIRHVTDLWVYQRAFPNMDEAYIAAELDKLHLLEFRENICRLLSVWFEGRPSDEKTDFITDFVFSSGSWGTDESRIMSDGVKRGKEAGSITKGRRNKMLGIVFLPLENMQQNFPILKKMPILLPACWVVRGVRALLFRRERIAEQRAIIQVGTAEKIETYQQALNYVGLDFHFEE